MILWTVLALVCSCAKSSSESHDFVSYVNPLYGTLSNSSFSTGNTYPATARPWGMHFWTPQTTQSLRDGWIYSYYKENLRMYGFRQTHQPSPWMGDYGQFSIMPFTGEATGIPSSAFSHKSEESRPYCYSVYLADYDCLVELTPTSHAAAFRLTYPESNVSGFRVDADGEIQIDGKRIYGTSSLNRGGVSENFANFFIIESDTGFEAVGDNVFVFKTSKGQVVNLSVASSFVSFEQADLNLAEVAERDFDTIKEEGHNEWNELLGRVAVSDDRKVDEKKIFYTCLYRSLLFPRDLSEIDGCGRRIHYSPHDGKVHDGYLFSDTGFWDTFRSLFALIDWVYPETSVAIQEGLVNHYLESGFLPEWGSPGHRDCMIGNNSASVVAEAYLKGLRGYDIDTLWEALVKDAHSVEPVSNTSGRRGWEEYYRLGYVPSDIGVKESAATTMEYAYDDWCIWQLGKALGKDGLEEYEKASQNYRNIYRPEYSMVSGKLSDGSWNGELNPYKWGGDFTEGNAIQYTWSVFHDPDGLMELMDGKEAFEHNLDQIFDLPPFYDDSYYGFQIHEIKEMTVMNYGNYAHGNQPAQHIAYMYNYCDKPEKTQFRVSEIMRRFYTAGPDCYCGDEDNGQTSAWYVFSALGFYPVCPASCEYALAAPLFTEVNVSVPGHRALNINTKGDAATKKASINGHRLGTIIKHDDLLKGGELSFR